MGRDVRKILLGFALLAALSGCDDDEGITGPANPAGQRAVSLSIGLAGGASASAAVPFGSGLELSDGLNTLALESAELVLREIEFERTDEPADCDQSGSGDACEKIEAGPVLVVLPLDGSVTTQLTAQIDTGTFDEIEFDVHKVDGEDRANRDFLDQNPNFRDISVRVTGTFNGQSFLFTSDLNEEQEIELASPLVVTAESGPANVTLTIDLSGWFRTMGDALIDPRTAVKGQPNENLVRDNIRDSIEGFRDDDGDGIRHEDDGDER